MTNKTILQQLYIQPADPLHTNCGNVQPVQSTTSVLQYIAASNKCYDGVL